jgi:cytochrome c oxidase assembly factor CtaG
MSALVAVLPAGALYAWGLSRGRRPPGWAAVAWFAGLAALALAASPWMDDAADRRLSMHMVQHELLGLVAAPLLVAGAPVRVALRAAPRRTARRMAALLRRPAVRALTHPGAGVAAFVAVLAAVHVPAVYDLSLRSGAVHAAVHAALLWSAVLLWLPLIGADVVPHRPAAAATVAALLGAMAAMAALGAVLAAEPRVVYLPYASRAAGALADQRLAGGLMSIGGMLVVLPALVGLAWRALLREERRAVAREARGLPVGEAR